jgi:hypothetical protein
MMSTLKFTWLTRSLAPLVLVAVGLLNSAQGVNVTFTLEPQSFLDLNGSFNNIGLLEQGPGSKTANYSGSITVDVDNVLAPSTIQFLSANAVASNSGSWLPEIGGGPAAGSPGVAQPANYGIFLPAGAIGNAYAAARDIVFNVTGPSQPVAAGSFGSGQTLTYLSGFFDTNLPPAFGSPPTRDDLTNDTRLNISANMSSYSVSGNTATLTLVYEDINPGGLTTVISGRLLATATVPEPVSLGWLAGLAGLGLRRRFTC